MLPDDLVLALADVLSLFFRDVAGAMDPAPDITYVSAVARVRVFDADRGQEAADEEEEGDDEEVAMEEEGDDEEVAMEEEGDDEEVAAEEEEGVGDGVEMEEENEEEPTPRAPEGEEEEQGEKETRCAICLGSMASGAAAEGRRERWWLPCCHCFHRGCLQRWLRQKAECPLCRAPTAASAVGGAGGEQHS